MALQNLDDNALEQAALELPAWTFETKRILRKFEFENFLEAIAFINQIAPLAESADHHPELFNVYNRVEIVLTTHDTGGITQKDVDLALQIEAI